MHDFNRSLKPAAQSPDLTISILDHLCMALDLTKTQRKTAEERYATVTQLLAAPDSGLAKYCPHLHVQGSFLHKTMVKPMAGVEFDVDLICLLHGTRSMGAKEMFQMVVAELKGRYPDLLVKDRCCRIDYAGEFHMDIIPACPETGVEPSRILIPDRRLEQLLPSCPKLYAAWFEEATQLMPVFITALSATDAYNAKSASVIEPLPDYDGMMQEPLRRFVQILKAARNHFYSGRSVQIPSSIVITTLAAHAYTRAVAGGPYESMLQVFRIVVEDLHNHIGVTRDSEGRVRLDLRNPKDARENFLDGWKHDEKSFQTFYEWQREVLLFIDRMTGTDNEDEGIDGAKKRLACTFGDSAATAAIRGIANGRREEVAIGRGGYLSSGILVPAAYPGARTTPKHTFDGCPTP
jgi:hypothetical protein